MYHANTTIAISERLRATLAKRKFSDKESYESVIWDLIEDTMELSEETKRELEESREEIRKGHFKTLAQVRKELGD
jgi:hypothetical protein